MSDNVPQQPQSNAVREFMADSTEWNVFCLNVDCQPLQLWFLCSVWEAEVQRYKPGRYVGVLIQWSLV